MNLARALLIALFSTLLLPPAALAATEVHVFQLENRQAESLLPQLQALYGGDNVVFSPDGQRLMVKAEAEQLAEIDQLLRVLDVAAAQLRITLRESSGGEAARQGTQTRTTSTSRQREQTLTVEDGQVAHIKSGQIRTLPVAARAGRDPAVLLEQVESSSGFLVQLNVLSSEQVELQITALKNDPVVGMPGHETAALVTMRRVNPGEWVTLGEESRARQARSDGRVITTETADSRNRTWEIKVDVLP